MNFKINCLVLFLINFLYNVHSASILALFSTLSYADQLVYRGYVEFLAHRGHHVVVMTPYPGLLRYPEMENIVELDVSAVSTPFYEEYKRLHSNVDDIFDDLRKINELSIKVTVAQLKSQQMTAVFINPNVQFDLVITEADMPILCAVAEKYKCPHIAITASIGKLNMFESKGSPTHPLLYKDVNTLRYGNINIIHRIEEYQRYWRFKYEYYYYFLPLCQMAAEKIVELKRDLLDVEKDIDMLFISGNQVLLGNRPISPAIVYVDNLHIKPDYNLPQDLQKYLDSSKKGFIYFALGTVQEAEELPEKSLQMIMDAVGELDYNVLFKIGNSTVKIPKNVHTSVWFPQQSILGHQNIKAFITHGGQRSLEEAIFYGVPVVGIPIVSTNKLGINYITNHGAGATIDPKYMTMDFIKKTVIEVASNKTYKDAMISLRQLSLDNVISGPDRSIWYTEYVLRHGGAKHLRSRLVGINLSQFFMLDFFGTLLIILIFIVVLILYFLRWGFRCFRSRSSKKNPKSKFKAL